MRKSGFTLIELIIVISIIAVLAGAVLSIINPITLQQRSRDARRKADLEAIRQALELYRAENKQYPAGSWRYSTSGTSWISELVPEYISQLPVDPVNNATRPWVRGNLSYGYYSGGWGGATPGNEYILVAQLEQGSGNQVKHGRWNWGNSVTYVVEEP
jgi:general secretion pathway protein G